MWLATSLAPTWALAGDTVTVHGSTTFNSSLLEPYQTQIEQAAGVKLTVVASKSVWGVLALLEGRADIAMISADLAGEVIAARKVVPELAYDRLVNFEVSRTRVAFAIHPDNPRRALKLDAVARILLGQIGNWREVGGPDLAIKVVATQDGGGSVVAVRTQLLGGQPLATTNAIRIESARHVIKIMQQEHGAIGIAQLGLLKAAGLPEIATDAPISQVLNLVTLGPPTPRLQAVLAAARAVATDKMD